MCLALGSDTRGSKDATIGFNAHLRVGVDPEALGSPWQTALASGASFATGAIFPVLPYLFGLSRWLSIGISAALSMIALIMVGLGISIVTGKQPLISAVRMLIVGAIAAGVTVTVGRLIGVTTS